MAEPTKEQLKRVCSLFLLAYNNQNKTNYKWSETKSYNVFSRDSSHLDSILFSKNKPNLNIQYKEIVWDVEYNKIRSKSATEIIKSAKNWAVRFGLENVFISTNFNCEKMPVKADEIDKIGYWISNIALLKQGDVKDDKYLFEYEKRDYELLEPILPYISEYIVRKSDSKTAVFGFGWSKDIPRGFPHYADIFLNIIKHKILKIDNTNTIFILEATSSPLDALDIKEIKEGIKDCACPEIWVVQDFLNQEEAIRIA